MMKLLTGSTICLIVALAPLASHAITRDRIVANGKAYGAHVWTPSAENVAVPAPCSDTWQPRHVAGKEYTGLPYDWGGFVTLEQFDADLAAGLRAGSYSSEGVLDCTTGVDCSGFVSQAWEASHHGTSTMSEIANTITVDDMLPGDAFNISGYHVILFTGKATGGNTKFCESVPSVGVHCGVAAPSEFTEYTPIRYNYTDPDGVGTGEGSIDDPIEITDFPFEHDGDTSNSDSFLMDRYSCAINTSEAGPEVVYHFTVAAPRTLDVSTDDEAGIDIDVHLLTQPDEDHCLIRHNKQFTYEIPEPGTYYIVADTYVDAHGVSYEGTYHLSVDFEAHPYTPPDAEAGPELVPDEAVPDIVEPEPDAPPQQDPGVTVETTPDVPITTDVADTTSTGDNKKSGGGGCSAGTPSSSMPLFLLLSLFAILATRRRSAA